MNDCLYRFDEDYSYLRNVSRDTPKDFFDPLKFIPLGPTDDIYLTFNANERINYYHNLLFNTPNPVGDRNEVDFRTNLGANLQIGPHIRLYADLWNGEYVGPNAHPAPAARNSLTTENAFIELMGDVSSAHVGLRVGRQFLWLGKDGLVISANELASVPVTWDGGRAYMNWGSGRIDAFWMELVNPTDGIESCGANSQTQLYGAYGTFQLPSFSAFGMQSVSSLDLYFLGYKNANGTYSDASLLLPGAGFGPPDFVVGHDTRNTFGVRYQGKFGPFELDNTGEYQGGQFTGKSVSAWMFASNNGYSFRNVPWNPGIFVHFDGASGGANGNAVHTYQPLFYSALYYNASLLLSPTNFIDLGPHLVFHPRPAMVVDVSDTSIWRQNSRDAVYNGLFFGGAPVNVYAGTAGVKGNYVGNQVGALMLYSLNKHVDFLGQLAYFVPGTVLRSIGATNKTQVVLSTTIKF